MRFIVDGTKYELDQKSITFAEGRAIEKVTGRTMGEIQRAGGDDVSTTQAMLWVAMKRQQPTMRFSDLDELPMGSIEMLPDEDEEPAEAGEADPTAAAEDEPAAG